MPQREPLSPLVNTPCTPFRPTSTKYASPSGSRHVGLSSPVSVFSSFEDQDEGRQKKELRRRSHGFELQRKNLGSPRSNSPAASDSVGGLTSTQLTSHYSDCIKLSAENKINSKNAFGLHLIDYMAVLVKKKELENFQVASSTLDASVKIYAGRVDFIHSHTYKVLSGLGGHQKSEDGDENGECNNEGADVPGAKKKRKTNKGHTTETNLKNINVDKFDLEFEVDPMFKMMSSAFDEGGAKGLLLNRLRSFDENQLLVLDSSTHVNVVEDVEHSDSQWKSVDVAAVENMLSNCHLDDKQICPSIANFQFTNWNGESQELPINSSDFAFDPNAEPQHLPSVEEEAELIAHEEVDNLDNVDDDTGAFNENSDVLSDALSSGDQGTAEFIESAFTDLSNGRIGKLRQILALEPSDYSYFNKILMRSWAGPAHWKISSVPRTTGTNGKLQDKGQSKRRKKAPLRLTYDTEEAELDKKFVHCKTTAVTKTTWSRYSKKRTTLPEDQQLDSQDRLFKLFHRPHIVIKRQTGDSIGVDDDELENYDYNNKNDVENFCPVVRDEDHSGDFTCAFDLSSETNLAPGSQMSILSQQSAFSEGAHDGTILTQDKLVAAPNRVQQIDIKYAKSAKRVDVKRLKSTMWNILSQETIPETKSKVPLPQVDQVAPAMLNQIDFSLLKDVLSSNVSTSMARNLTIQTVFACLLYLTNEKTLKLSSSECLNDITIVQDPDS